MRVEQLFLASCRIAPVPGFEAGSTIVPSEATIISISIIIIAAVVAVASDPAAAPAPLARTRGRDTVSLGRVSGIATGCAPTSTSGPVIATSRRRRWPKQALAHRLVLALLLLARTLGVEHALLRRGFGLLLAGRLVVRVVVVVVSVVRGTIGRGKVVALGPRKSDALHAGG